MEMRKSWRRLIYLVIAVWFINFGNFIANQQKDLLLEHQLEIDSLKEELSMAKADLEATREDYRDSLCMIVKNLYEEETYGTGGFEVGSQGNIDVLYEVIMNATLDFTSLLENVENYFDKRKEYIETVPSIWPLEYDSALRITSGFGWRISPFTDGEHWHTGIDVASVYNAGIMATADGVVVDCWPAPDGYYRGHPVLGGTVVIKHSDGFRTVYGHMNKVFVHEGQVVERGQMIGIVGDTGKARGRHLHYEVKKDGNHVDPIDYLSSNRILVMFDTL